MIDTRIPITDLIHTYMHCGLCLDQKQPQKIEAGFTRLGLQVWCARHQVNVIHFHFEGRELAFNDQADSSGAARVLHPRNNGG